MTKIGTKLKKPSKEARPKKVTNVRAAPTALCRHYTYCLRKRREMVECSINVPLDMFPRRDMLNEYDAYEKFARKHQTLAARRKHSKITYLLARVRDGRMVGSGAYHVAETPDAVARLKCSLLEKGLWVWSTSSGVGFP
jgi:hypothetical protein